MHYLALVSLLFSFSSVFAHPAPQNPSEAHNDDGPPSAKVNTADFDILYAGNQAFRVAEADLITKLAVEGQAPPFLFLGCADSRISEGTIFDAPPGTFFTERNIANQYSGGDINVQVLDFSSLAYGIEHLKVKHIVVLGHYGCGGVQASIASPPQQPWDDATKAIQDWVKPIRQVYQTSNRAEILASRNQNQGNSTVPGPHLHDAGFRALVEENVKNTVKNIAEDEIIQDHYHHRQSAELYIHGWVYDIENGEIRDLDVSVGPPGKPLPSAPWEVVASAAQNM
ncbi:carbonic anhydrase [Coprinopsis sp. MPI-PUGE-AT-0042]|nr:carbonic anhydrase [Coprinopsis sp. MPI-PUGE-AT-0042]